MSQTECPKCHALQARRVKQAGLLQKAILQRLGYFPWECRFCKATFVLKKRGHRRGDSQSADPLQQVLTEQSHHGVSGD